MMKKGLAMRSLRLWEDLIKQVVGGDYVPCSMVKEREVVRTYLAYITDNKNCGWYTD